MTKMKHSRPPLARTIAFLTGGMLGVLVVLMTHHLETNFFGLRFFLLVLLFLLMMVLNLPVAILHELGHMLGGLLSGQRLFYLCVGRLYIVRRASGQLRFAWRRTPGVSGACAMYSPRDGISPLALMLGGPLMNLLTGLVFAFLTWQTRPVLSAAGVLQFSMLHIILLLLTMLSLEQGVTNLLPFMLTIGGTDGWQLRLHLRSPEAREDYARLVRISRALQRETRIKDMPDEWFIHRPPEPESNLYALSLMQNIVARLMDKGDFSAALEAARPALNEEIPFAPLLRMHMLQDGAVCEMLLGQPGECTARLRDETILRLRKLHKGYLSVLRTDYAAALLLQGDKERAASIRADFERIAAAYPFVVDAAAETDLMNHIRQIAESASVQEVSA